MAKHRFDFRVYATDLTEYWTLPEPLKGATVFGVYFLLEDEATHICSFERNSRCEFLRNEFVGADDPEAAHEYLDNGNGGEEYEDGGEGTAYFGYVDCKDPENRPYLSERISFTLDSETDDFNATEYAETLERALRFESPQKARATAQYNALREAAYEEAREYLQGNWRYAPVLGGGAALEAHKARMAERKAAYEARYARATAPAGV